MTSQAPRAPKSPDEAVTEQVHEELEKAEAGDATSAKAIATTKRSDPHAVEAVEQAASEGPEGRGLAR